LILCLNVLVRFSHIHHHYICERYRYYNIIHQHESRLFTLAKLVIKMELICGHLFRDSSNLLSSDILHVCCSCFAPYCYVLL